MMRIPHILVATLTLFICTNAYSETWVNHHADNFNNAGHWNYDGTVDVVNDSTTPDSTTGVWRFTFPQGIKSKDIAMVYFPLPDVTEIWVRYHFKYSSDFTYHNIATKQGYLYTTGFGKTNSSNCMFLLLGNKFNITSQGSDFANYLPNVKTTLWYSEQKGKWHSVKMYLKFNTGSNWNGKYKLWIDDELVSDYSNVMYDSRYSGWEGIGIRPIWGGISGLAVPQTQYFFVDGLYVGSTDPGATPPGKTPSSPSNLNIK